jgi:hypothetical protein
MATLIVLHLLNPQSTKHLKTNFEASFSHHSVKASSLPEFTAFNVATTAAGAFRMSLALRESYLQSV